MLKSPQQTPLRGATISPLIKSHHQSNMSLTNYSWDKTLFEGLQNRKFNTDEDQALYSYSKFSASNPTSDIKQYDKEQAFVIPGSQTNNPLKDYPQLLTQLKTGRTTTSSKQKSQQEDLQSALQELSKRVSLDQITIQRLQESIQDKDKIIVQLQKSQRWLTDQADSKSNNVMSQRDEISAIRQNQKLQRQITDSETQVKLSETQLRNSLRQLNTQEKENCLIKNDKLILEQHYYKLIQRENHFNQIKEQLQQDLEEERIHSQETIQQLRLQIDDQQNIMAQWNNQLKKLQFRERNNSQVLMEKLEKKTDFNSQDRQSKFVDCIVDMVQNCQKSIQKPSLKKCWKQLKDILQDYMHLKQDDLLRQDIKASQQKHLSIHSNQSKNGQKRMNHI